MKSLLSTLLLLAATLTLVESADIVINPWHLRAPNSPYENYNASVGDTITFFWSDEDSSVYIHPTLSCDTTDSIWVGDASPAGYTFLEIDGS